MSLDGSDVTAVEEGGDDEGCHHYKYTKRSGNFTSRNGGWSREGVTLYTMSYTKKVRGDRQTDDGAFGKLYMDHRASLCRKRRNRRNANGADHQHQLAISDDLEQVWTAADIEERADI